MISSLAGWLSVGLSLLTKLKFAVVVVMIMPRLGSTRSTQSFTSEVTSTMSSLFTELVATGNPTASKVPLVGAPVNLRVASFQFEEAV
jgi:hypothetical protein